MSSFSMGVVRVLAPASGKFRAKQRLLGVALAAVLGVGCSSEPL